MAVHEADVAALLAAIAGQVLRRASHDGETTTAVPGMSLFRLRSALLAGSGVLRPSVCVVVQGAKIAHAGDSLVRYRAGDFLVSSIHMPLVGQPVGASRAKPYLAVAFELAPHDVLSVVQDAELGPDDAGAAHDSRALFVGKSDARLLEVVLRCVRSLDDPRAAGFLAPLLRRELVYRLVTGACADQVRRSALLARNEDGVGRVIDWIREHFKQPFEIADLAQIACMSTSSLYKKFKATVMMGPLQYQKRLRLEEARRLLLAGRDSTHAAFDVGYESPSQFTREYRRQFGLPPLRDVKQLRNTMIARATIGQKASTIGQEPRRSRP